VRSIKVCCTVSSGEDVPIREIAYAPFTLLRPLRNGQRTSLLLLLLLILILSGIHILLTPLLRRLRLRLLPLLRILLSMVVVVIVSVDA
jgi:hypothetical protein